MLNLGKQGRFCFEGVLGAIGLLLRDAVLDFLTVLGYFEKVWEISLGVGKLHFAVQGGPFQFWGQKLGFEPVPEQRFQNFDRSLLFLVYFDFPQL